MTENKGNTSGSVSTEADSGIDAVETAAQSPSNAADNNVAKNVRNTTSPSSLPSTHAAASSLSEKEREEIAQLPYEEARDRLIQSVQALEAGGLNLDQSMRQWEVGEALAQRAQSLLNDVRAKLDAAQAQQETSANTAGTQSNLE